MNIQELAKDTNFGIEYIVCPICGQRMKHLHWSHAKKHNTTRREIAQAYPEFPLTRSKTKDKYAEAGRTFSDEGLEAIRQSTIKRNLENNPMDNPDNVAKSVANFKRTHRRKWKEDEEYRRKWSDNSSAKMKKLHQNPEFHSKRVENFLSYVRSEAHSARTRSHRLSDWKNPEYAKSILNKALGFCIYYIDRKNRKIRLKSRYELAFAVSMDISEIDYEYEPQGFDYEVNGELHTYYPDFLCEDVFYEIKGYKDKLTDIKLSQCLLRHNLNIILIQGEELFDKYSIVSYDTLVKLASRNSTVSYEQVIAEYKSLN